MSNLSAFNAKTLAEISLPPGAGLSRQQRRFAEDQTFAFCEVQGALEPWRAFDRTTLRWAIFNASHISIWSGSCAEHKDAVARWTLAARDEVAHAFITMVSTTPERAAEWLALVDRWKRRSTTVRVFGAPVSNPKLDTYLLSLSMLD
jgi:hypothetical protein